MNITSYATMALQIMKQLHNRTKRILDNILYKINKRNAAFLAPSQVGMATESFRFSLKQPLYQSNKFLLYDHNLTDKFYSP
jgi:hypothetical protein